MNWMAEWLAAFLESNVDDLAEKDAIVLDQIREHLTGSPSGGADFCDKCAGPYPTDSWPGSQYNGHWDTCPNRTTGSPSGGPEPLEGT